MRALSSFALRSLLAVGALVSPARAEKPAPIGIAGVNSILQTPAETPPRSVVFRGVVNQRSPHDGGVFIQDESAGIFVRPPAGVPLPAPGAEIEVRAAVGFTRTSPDTEVRAAALRVLGQPGLSPPVTVTVPELLAGKCNRLAVQIEGTVLQAQEGGGILRGTWWLVLTNRSGTFMCGVYSWPESWQPDALSGKTVRVRGVSAGSGALSLRCSSPDDIAIIEPPAEPPHVLGSVPEILDLMREKDRAAPRPFSLRGICTCPGPQRAYFYLQAAGAAVVVFVAHPGLCPEFGEEVRICGVTNSDQRSVWAEAWAVEWLGQAKLPEPQRFAVAEAVAPMQFRRWVETEGTVLQARPQAQGAGVQLHIADESGWALVNLGKVPAGCDPAAWFGARVRVRGVATLPQILVAQPDAAGCFTLLAPGRSDVFAAPSAPRRATVLDVRDGWVYARDPAGAFRAQMLAPFDPTEKEWKPAAPPISIPPLHPGDTADFTGLPMKSALLYAQARVSATGQTVEPAPASLPAAARGTGANDFVTLHGRLREYRSGTIADGRWRETLRLAQDGAEIEAVLEQPVRSSRLAAFKIDDRLEVTGIVRPEDGTPPYRLCLRSTADARSLGLAPEVLHLRQLRTFGIAGGIVALAAALVFFMARKLADARLLATERERANAAVRGMNSELEKRVVARTAELERAQDDLRLALANERELGQLKTAFVALVSHEFRTPLNVIVTSSDILARYLDRLPAGERDEHLASIGKSAKRMSHMMEDVLLLGQFESGRQKFQPEELHLAAWCRRFTDEMQSATGARCPIELSLGEFEPVVRADESILRHVLANLVSNAAKYSPPGEPVKISVAREGADAVFRIEDHGIGIPAADRARLFEAFQRGGNVGQINGTGLGLVVVKRGVELHGGSLDFTSEENRGSAFTVRLPLFAAGPDADG